MKTRASRVQCCWVMCCLFAASLPGYADTAQMLQLRIIGADAGLPSSEIVGLGQDVAGDVWIAGKDGLARYDGIGMQVWRHDPEDPGSLPENRLQALHVGVDGRIWVGGVSQGAAVLNPADGRVTRYGAERFAQMRSHSILSIASERGAVWLGSMDGLYRIDDDDGFRGWWHEDGNPASLPAATVVDLAFDDDGVLWVATTGGLARIGTDGALQRIALPGSTPAPLIYSVVATGGQLWVGTPDGVITRRRDGDWERSSWSAVFARPNAMLDLALDPAGGLWLGSQRGAWRVSPEGIARPVRPTVEPVGMAVFSLLLQADGALWVPVYGQGLGYLRSDWRRVTQFARGTANLTGDHYFAITPARKGGHWLLARNGVVERMDARGVAERLPAQVLDALGRERPRALAVDDAGAFWMVGHNRVLRISRHGKIERWRHDDARDAALPGTNLRVVAAPGGRIWVNNAILGLQVRDAASGAVLRNFLAGDPALSGFHPGDLEQMEIGPDGALWVAGVDGLVRMSLEHGAQGEAALRGARVLAFGFAGERTLWLFRAQQLERFEYQDGQWRWVETVGIGEGLPVMDPGGLRVDARQRVWLSTPRGLYRWDPATRHVQHVGVQHGLQSQEFVERVLALDADGMLVGTTIDGGVVMVDTGIEDPPAVTPRLNLRQIAVRRDGQWQPQWLSPAPDTALTLTHDEREFRISMRLPHFDAPASNRYWSKLQGYDADWVAQGEDGDRIFSGIPPGHYRLNLRAADASGNRSDIQTLNLNIRPPWWDSAGFHGSVLITLAALLLAAALMYRRRLQRRHTWQLAARERSLAEESSRAKTRFLATFGHEVRTPMTGVLGMSELLLATTLNPQQQDYAHAIHHSGQHLLRLVNDALDLARIESGRLELERRPFALHQMLSDIAALQTPLALARGLRFEHEVAADVPPWVIGDGGRVRQILLNLLGNAIKFTERGTVGFRARPLPDARMAFTVTDTGPGLNAEQRERLFRRFEQAEGARTAARYGGSGLGLAISQELAAAMGGRIDVDSRPGQGTSFVVTLPLPAAATPAAMSTASAMARIPALHLLLVEDDATIATVITGLLHAQGHSVVHAADGLGALAEAAQTRFDLALLDLDLPGVDGLRLAELLRRQGMRAPLIAITARADAEAEPDAMAAGFAAFIRKPMTGEMLAEVMLQGLGLESGAAASTKSKTVIPARKQ